MNEASGQIFQPVENSPRCRAKVAPETKQDLRYIRPALGIVVVHLSGGFSFQIRGGGGGHPDPEIRGGGLKKNFFWPFGPQFGLKNKGGPWPLPWIPHCTLR